MWPGDLVLQNSQEARQLELGANPWGNSTLDVDPADRVLSPLWRTRTDGGDGQKITGCRHGTVGSVIPVIL